MTRAGNVLVLSATVFVSLAACSSEDASPASTPVAVTAAPSTDPSPPSSSSPLATDPRPTTQDPNAALAAEVEADLLEIFRLTDLAIQDPTNDEKVAAALEGYVESNRGRVEAQIDELRDNGWVARPNPDVPAQIVVESPAVLSGSKPDTAVIKVCQIDTWIIVEPGAGPAGSDAVVNPDLASYRTNFVMALLDGRWRVRGGEPLGTWPEAGCADE